MRIIIMDKRWGHRKRLQLPTGGKDILGIFNMEAAG
jgi:hypothetical protein